ncbi:synaptotagmin-16 [Anopheles nili]|uniref:synaptotagmin-16 n=1 Tax=Anopheles nili TaxID=185578 RepID=UPI00237B7220|nr:synaptotagmin-16 [Anopheles nili]
MVQFVEGSSDNQQEMDELNFAGRLQAHMELTTFLGLALGFVALILVLFLYVNKIRCFGSTPPFLSFDEHLISEKTFHRIRNRFAYDGNNSSDSEDESLRRLKLEPCIDSYTNSASCYHTNENILDHTPHFNSYNKILSAGKLTHSSQDLLAMAEGGKIGMPHSSNDCSSGSSIEVNLDYGTRLSLDAHVSNDRLANAESNSCIEGRIVETTDLKMRDNMLLPELTKESDQREVPIRKKSSKSSTSHRLESDSIGTCVASNETSVIDLKSKVLADESTPAAPVVDSYRQVSLTQQDSLEDVLSLNNDCILVFSHEPLYDTSDLKSLKSDGDAANAGFDGPSSASGSNGTLEISLLYDAPMRKMTVHVLQARGISSRGDKGQLTHTQVRLLMLPAKRQKHKTKIRSGENPQFMESFLLHRVNPEEVNSMGLRIRVYGCERMRRERLIGETIVSFANIDLELETNLWLPLESRTTNTDTASTSDLLSIARSDSAGSTTSMQHGGVPELLLGLGYNGITGRLTVEIVKGSHFRNHSLPKVPDTYVKLCLVSSMGQEIARSKTSTRRGQSNPLFKETFIFQVALFQLNDVTLIVSIYAKRNMKRNEMVGWFSMGLNSSGPEEMIHWNEMRESSSRSELITRWHVLVDS